jgi:hypothetical protein
LGSIVSGVNFSSILNGMGNEISQSEDRIRSACSTILNGHRNKILSNSSLPIDLTEINNANYTTILNGSNNTISHFSRSYSTIINGANNNISGVRNTLIFGKDNFIIRGEGPQVLSRTPQDYFVFGENISVSGSLAEASEASDRFRDFGFVFGKEQNLNNLKHPFIFGKTYSNITQWTNREDYYVSNCEEPILFHITSSKISGANEIFLNHGGGVEITGGTNLVGNNIDNLELIDCSQSIINNSSRSVSNLSTSVNASNNLYIDSSDNCEVSNSSHLKIFGGQNSLTGAHRCSIFGSGNKIFSNSTADTEKVRYVNIWGDGNEVTGQSKSLSIQGTGNKFIRSTIGAEKQIMMAH